MPPKGCAGPCTATASADADVTWVVADWQHSLSCRRVSICLGLSVSTAVNCFACLPSTFYLPTYLPTALHASNRPTYQPTHTHTHHFTSLPRLPTLPSQSAPSLDLPPSPPVLPHHRRTTSQRPSSLALARLYTHVCRSTRSLTPSEPLLLRHRPPRRLGRGHVGFTAVSITRHKSWTMLRFLKMSPSPSSPRPPSLLLPPLPTRPVPMSPSRGAPSTPHTPPLEPQHIPFRA